MTEQSVALVKKTWKLFCDIDPLLIGDVFYTRLFTGHPALRKLFPKDMKEQYAKLMSMLTTIVSRLDRLEELSQEIADMGRRHVEYGVKPSHYKLVGDALFWTLKQGLGKDWTPQVEVAWKECYTVLSDTMITAAGRQSS